MIWLLVHILPRSSFLRDQPAKPRILLLLRRSGGPKVAPQTFLPSPAAWAERRIRGRRGCREAAGRPRPRAANAQRARERARRRRGALQGAGPAAGTGTGRRRRPAGQRGGMQHRAAQGLRLLQKSRPWLIASCALIEMTSQGFFFFIIPFFFFFFNCS